MTANNASQIISIYKDFVKNPSSVDQSWHNFFKELAPEELAILDDYEKLDSVSYTHLTLPTTPYV